MAKTIEAFAEMITEREIECAIKTKDGFAVSLSTGDILILDRECQVISRHHSGGTILAMKDTDSGIIIVNMEGDIVLINGNDTKDIFTGAECKVATFSEDNIFISQENDRILTLDTKGESRTSVSVYEPMMVCSSDVSNYVVVGSEGGSMTILDGNLAISHHSGPRDDDIEVISDISSGGLGKFLVARSSLGLMIDERAVNRIELWDVKIGLVGEAEVPSRITCIAPYGDGYVAGCFEGEIIMIEGNLQVTTISKMDYSISEILEWKGDIIVSYWFFVERISQSGTNIWSYEHQNLVKGILKLENDEVVTFGTGGVTNHGNQISIILPDGETIEDVMVSSTDVEGIEFSDEKYSGLLSENESSSVSLRAPIEGIEDLISEIVEPIKEAEYEIEGQSVDLLESLASTARSLNIPPVADAGEDVTISSNEDSKADVILDGSGSYDPDGEIVAWSWSTESGRSLGQSKIVRVRLALGVHVFTLKVTDNMGAEDESSMTVRVT
tara:strand:- start:4033 stop:5529 length:1497 start_codon:yes stop_codon:yes gene_type:complete